jgi:vitamin B12 transporter
VTTIQAGVETSYIPWLWLKTTFFWNQLSDIQEYDYAAHKAILKKQLKQGVEVEGKTVPIFNTSLSAGYTFIDTKDRETGETLQGVPRQIVKLGIHFDDDQHSFRGSLLGRYSWLNSFEEYNGKYDSVIWDLNLTKKVFKCHDTAAELFFNAHNLFNGAQYNRDDRQNARRWFEGGIKFSF